MAMYTSTGEPLLTDAEVADLLVTPVLAATVATAAPGVLSTLTRTASHVYRIPRITEDATASWTAEGQEIAPSDLAVDEIVTVPAKVAGLSVLSSEMVDDSNGAAPDLVGDSLVRDVARRIDEAFCGTPGGLAPPGLESTNPTEIDGGGLTNLDPFAEAVAAVEGEGGRVTGWLAHPQDALALVTMKDSDGSARALLAADPTQPGARVIEGRPMLTSPAVTRGSVWAVDGSRVHVIVRQDASVEVDSSIFFSSDRVAVRAIMRVGFAFAHEPSIARIALTSPTA